ncbi:hypothetical protein HZB07_07215 [Candidatus Saganbacteria bacterium]|nr:hypothetical protein [Candidatus Saganbacteria bacterium]
MVWKTSSHATELLLSFCFVLLLFTTSCSEPGTYPSTTATTTSTSLTTSTTVLYSTIVFSGYTWNVKHNDTSVGPGPNIFSNSSNNVWVDTEGQLHLKITHRDNAWQCAEVYLQNSLGYGKYIFQLVGRPDQINQNAVLGLFTWDDTSSDAVSRNYREMDIEFTRWSDPAANNLQFTVQPYTRPGNTNFKRFNLDLSGQSSSTHFFQWQNSNISFESARGYNINPLPADILATWEYSGIDLPNNGQEKARINLWLNEGRPPSNNSEVEVVVHIFQFVSP